MIVNVKIKTGSDCSIIIKDCTKYKSEDNSDYNTSLKYSETLSFDVILRIKLDEDTTIAEVFTLHSESNTATISLSLDGKLRVTHFIIPTKEWFENYNIPEGFPFDYVYYSDGERIYQYYTDTEEIKEITWDQIITIDGSDVYYTQQEFVSVCYLRQCYINFCKLIFNDKAFSSCWNNSNVDSELVYKRDLTWMALNVIKYLVECEQLEEAERYIEILESCNGLCNSSSNTKKNCGCGCSK